MQWLYHDSNQTLPPQGYCHLILKNQFHRSTCVYECKIRTQCDAMTSNKSHTYFAHSSKSCLRGLIREKCAVAKIHVGVITIFHGCFVPIAVGGNNVKFMCYENGKDSCNYYYSC